MTAYHGGMFPIDGPYGGTAITRTRPRPVPDTAPLILGGKGEPSAAYLPIPGGSYYRHHPAGLRDGRPVPA